MNDSPGVAPKEQTWGMWVPKSPEVGFEPATNGLTVRCKAITYNTLQFVAKRKSKAWD